jgi:Family of unknown function (DUF6504)
MRRYDDPVEVRKGWIGDRAAGVEGPEQFLWHGKLWKVREVIAHWVETGSWWASADARLTIGSAEVSSTDATGLHHPLGLLDEREIWRVEAGPGLSSGGVFELAFDWSNGTWQLLSCVD